MTSTVQVDASLQDLLRSSLGAPNALEKNALEKTTLEKPVSTPIQLSPATFKSAIASLLDLLSEQRIPAIVWAKLPKSDAWQAELDRYRRLHNTVAGFYTFRCGREEEPASANQPIIAPDAQADTLEIQLVNPGMRRDYFLIVWSPVFQGLLLTQKQMGAASEDPEDSERRAMLQGFWSCNLTLLDKTLSQIEQAVVGNGDIVSTWRDQMANLPVTVTTQPFLEQLFARQLQKQEDIWQRRTAYRKQAEMVETLQSQNQELSNSVRQKDNFLSNAGQELRTPLTTIKTALTLLNSPSLKQPQRQRYMDLIAKECDRQSTLITSLLDLVQLEQTADHTPLQSIQLADIVPGVVSTYQPVAEEKGVMLAYTVPDSLPPVLCTPNWLQKLVVNLLYNGIKFTPNGGRVWVRASQHMADFVQIEFQDTGVGLAPHEIPKVFERFYRVRQLGEEEAGAGLGLCIVKQILDHCGGNITVRSKPGEGSSFVVSLPIDRSV